ncbi:hypothetical protein HMPREF9406_2390 [Clostridium sp. HGF2]|nr:hypothetical protein HMPREF9406_2390 [Clostridium sp. HGF2]
MERRQHTKSVVASSIYEEKVSARTKRYATYRMSFDTFLYTIIPLKLF